MQVLHVTNLTQKYQKLLQKFCVCAILGLTVGSVRLSSVTQSGNSQRVEVLYDERWGTVCREGWDTSDGNVVCRALGLGKAVIENSPTFEYVFLHKIVLNFA